MSSWRTLVNRRSPPHDRRDFTLGDKTGLWLWAPAPFSSLTEKQRLHGDNLFMATIEGWDHPGGLPFLVLKEPAPGWLTPNDFSESRWYMLVKGI